MNLIAKLRLGTQMHLNGCEVGLEQKDVSMVFATFFLQEKLALYSNKSLR